MKNLPLPDVPPEEAVAQVIAYPEGPVVLVDVGDNIGGRMTGDGTVILAKLLSQGARDAVVVIANHAAVHRALQADVGAEIALAVGGKVDRLHRDPVAISGTVRLLSDDRWTREGPENAGVPVNNGPIAVIDVAGNLVVLTTTKTAPGDLPITKHHIDVDTPGLGSVNSPTLTSMRFGGRSSRSMWI